MLTSQQTWATQNNNGNNWMFIAYNGYDNSENVISQTEGFGPGVPWNNMTFLNGQFQYDGLNRLFSVTDTNYTRTYHYDEFGNQSIQSYTGISRVGYAPQNNGTNPFNPATNHMVSVDAAGGYEQRGMVTKLGVGPTVTMDYDAEGNMKDTNYPGSGPSLTWIYDAEGQRAQQRVNGGSWTLYIHDAFGQLAATYNNNGVTPACTTCYLTCDMLGSVRLVTDQNQNVVARHDFIPFGEEIPDGTAGRVGNFAYTSNVTQAFTGQEEDGGNAVLHYFNARHLSGALGSFMQPDPGNAGASLTNPQSWNGYSYVDGNPLGNTDPTGACTVVIGGITQSKAPSNAITAIAQGLGAVEAYPYSGLDPISSILGVALQGFASTTNTTVALSALQYALNTNSGKIDVLAYSGGAGAFTSAYEQLSSSDQQRIGTILYISPGASGLLATNNATSVVRGNDAADIGAMIGTGYPLGTPVEQAACRHTNTACLSNTKTATRAFTAMQANGPCSSQETFSFQWPWGRYAARGTASSTINYGGESSGTAGGILGFTYGEEGNPIGIGVLGGSRSPKPPPARPF